MSNLLRRGTRHARRSASGSALSLALLVLAAGCSADAPGLTEPGDSELDLSLHRGSHGARTIVVRSSAELLAALSPDNAGKRILLRAGDYQVEQLIVVPDGVVLEGSGKMRLDRSGRPVGFRSGSRTAIVMAGAAPGNLLSLGNGSALKRLVVEDAPGRAGNAIGVVSRNNADRVSATVSEVEVFNPNAHGVTPQGPTGCGVVVLTQNLNMGNAPEPHADSRVALRMTQTLVRSPATGTGCGVFAFNFASASKVSVTLSRNIVGGGIIASGGVSRPDAVNDSRTVISSSRNIYRDDSPDACISQSLGWNLQGGSGMPVPLPNPGAQRNRLEVHSVGDRLERFRSAILATGARRFFDAPVAQSVNDNKVELRLIDTHISTTECAGDASADLRLAGALVSGSFEPGSGNSLHAVMRGIRGSGPRANEFAHVLGPSGSHPELLSGVGNRLSISGNARSFARWNRRLSPMPDAAFFTGGGR